MPRNIQCKKCYHLQNDWCDPKLDSPDPDLVRDCQYYKTATNADRIRAYDDRKLAEFCAERQYEIARELIKIFGGEAPIDKNALIGEWLEFLTREVE